MISFPYQNIFSSEGFLKDVSYLFAWVLFVILKHITIQFYFQPTEALGGWGQEMGEERAMAIEKETETETERKRLWKRDRTIDKVNFIIVSKWLVVYSELKINDCKKLLNHLNMILKLFYSFKKN
jgi:hypothetical protein